ncbi:MAG: hypothetical protein HOV79_12980 [Hamadaea sp.]|nr:hypothetical protein [Hamadaea sp.]
MNRLTRSSLALMASTAATAGLGMLFWAVAAWAFEAAEVGRASAGSSAMLLLATLGQLALTSVFARVLPPMTHGRARFVLGGYAVVALICLLLTAAFFGIGFGDGFLTPSIVAVAVFGAGVAATAVSVVQDGALVALDRAAWVPVKNTALAVARMVLLPLLARTAAPEPILVAWAAPTVAAFVAVNLLMLVRRPPAAAGTGAQRPGRRDIARLVGGQYANSVVNAVILFSPPVLVTAVLGPQANAVFFLPWTITTALIGLLWNVVVPFVVEASGGRADVGANLRQMVRAGTVITVGGALALVILGPFVLRIAGSTYADDGAPVLRLLAIALPFAAIGSYFNAAELVRLRSSVSLATKVLAAVLFLGAAVPAMHAAGVSGAAAAYLASQVIVGVLLLPPVLGWLRSHRPAPGRAEATLAVARESAP